MPEVSSSANQKVILSVVALAVFMATLDGTIVNISLPTIAGFFHADIGLVSWVVMAYLLVLSGFMLACGRLGDIRGFRRVFIAGFSLFTLGSILCGLASSIGFLVAFRIIQGVGAAAIEAMAPAMIVLCLPAEKRGWALGILMTIVSLAMAAGPVLGGYITEYLGWHWIFFINVPVGILAVILTFRYIPVDQLPAKPGRFDTPGAVLILCALATFLFLLNQGLYAGWTSPLILGSLCISLVFWILFVLHERHCREPLVDLRLFSSRNYLWGNIAGMLIIFVFAGSEFLLPFYFELVHGIPTPVAGVFLAVPAVTLILAGPVGGKLSDRYGSRWLMIGSALVSACTMYLFMLLDSSTGFVIIIIALAIEGFAVGIFMPPNMRLILGSSRSEGEGGVASSVMMTLRNIGGVLGIAIFGTIAVQVIIGVNSGPGAVSPGADQLIPGFRAAFLSGVIVCIGVAIISAAIRESPAADRTVISG